MTGLTTLPSHDPSAVGLVTVCRVRRAQRADIPSVRGLIDQWADAGLTLRRSESDLSAAIRDFAIVERGDAVIACAAMEAITPRLAEIRSVSVDRAAMGSGAGRLAVFGLVERAVSEGVEQLVLLTKTPAFFARLGFAEVAIEDGPTEYIDGSLVRQGRQTAGRVLMARAALEIPTVTVPAAVSVA